MEELKKAALRGLAVVPVVLIAGLNLVLSWFLWVFSFFESVVGFSLLIGNIAGIAGGVWLVSSRRALLGIVAVLVVLPASYGIARLIGPHQSTHWDEEVELSPGNVVTVARADTRLRSSPIPGNTGAGPSVSRKIEIPRPQANVRWTGAMWEIPLAMATDDRDTLFLAVSLHSRELCERYAYPPGSVVFTRWANGQWEKIDPTAYPPGGKANLLRNPWGEGLKNTLWGTLRTGDKKSFARGNEAVGEPLEKILADRSRDSCAMVSKGPLWK